MRFNADSTGRTHVDLPDRWSGADHLYDALHDISVQGAAMSRPMPAELVLTSAPRAPIVLRYRLTQDFQGAPAVGAESPFRPVTQPNWFTAVGWTIFGEVEGRHGQPITFHWGPTPQGWTVASDLDDANTKGRKTEEMFDSVLVGGSDITLIERPSPGGGMLRIAIHGKWDFDPKRVADLVEKIEVASAAFWREKGENFFVAMTPLDSHGQTVQYGVGLGDAFSLWATRNQDEESLRHILAHEHQHTWLPTRIGGVRVGPDEPMDYWLSEGFTDFYTLRILLRSGVYSLTDFVNDYNRILRAYSDSPVRDAPNRLIAARFWDDRAVADLPYQRGLLLAALWDQRMGQLSHGARNLDTVIMKMKDDADARRPSAARGAPANLLAAYKALGGGDLAADMTRYVDNGQRVLLPADMFGDCATVETLDAPVFARGFHTAATHDGVIQNVDPNGPAFAAGLRNGMRIIRREAGRPGDPNAPLTYRVDDHGVERVISYLPVGRSHATLQQIVLAKDMTPEKTARCTRVLAGELEPTPTLAPTPAPLLQPAASTVAAASPAAPAPAPAPTDQRLSTDRVVQPSTLYSGQTPATPVSNGNSPK
jgi:predicted metalloprotease with PDZ domain